MRVILLLMFGQLGYAAGPTITNLLLDQISKSAGRVTLNTSAVGTTTNLASTIGALDTSLTLTSATGFPSYCVLQIDSERINAGTLNGTTYTITRGWEATTAASHSAGATVQCLTNEILACWRLGAGSYSDNYGAKNGLVPSSMQSLFNSSIITGLMPGTTYYWKVRAQPHNNSTPLSCIGSLPAGASESTEATFTTAANDGNHTAALPTANVAVTMPSSFAATYTVAVCADIQTYINTAAAADANLNYKILIPAALTCGGFYLKNKTGTNSGSGTGGGTGTIVIRSAALDSALPPTGVRVSPAYAGVSLPRIQNDGSSVTVVTDEDYVAGYYLLGLDVGLDPQADANLVSSYVTLMSLRGTPGTTDGSKQEKRITIDRCYIGGNPKNTQNVASAMTIRGANIAVINSYIHNVNAAPGHDGGGINWSDGSGPFLIENNYVEGGSIGVFIGDDGQFVGVYPSDVTIRRNHILKPLSYFSKDPSYATQTLLTVTNTSATNPVQLTTSIAHDVGNSADPATSVTVSGGAGACAGINSTWTPTRISKNVLSVPFDNTSAGCSGLSVAYARSYQLKNDVEFKQCTRCLIEGNVLEQVWGYPNGTSNAQSGYLMLTTLRGPQMLNGWLPNLAAMQACCAINRTTSDITIRYNIFRNSGGGFNLSGWDEVSLNAGSRRVNIYDNLMYGIDGTYWGEQAGGAGQVAHIVNGMEDLTIQHNTFLGNYSRPVQVDWRNNSGLFFDSNIMPWGSNGVWWYNEITSTTGLTFGTRPMDTNCTSPTPVTFNPPFYPLGDTNGTNYSFTRNVIIATPVDGDSDPDGYGYGVNRFKAGCTPPDNRDFINNSFSNNSNGGLSGVGFTNVSAPPTGLVLGTSSLFRAGVARIDPNPNVTGAGAVGAGPGADGADAGAHVSTVVVLTNAAISGQPATGWPLFIGAVGVSGKVGTQ